MKYLVAILLTAIAATNTFAQSKKATPFTIGTIEQVQSKVLNEKRILNIYLPEGYDTSKATYPVIYVLDGTANEDFLHTAGLVQYLSMYDMMPKSIVVGVANVDRRRDFTNTTTVEADKKLIPVYGGSEKFRTFLSTELLPFIEANYRTNHHKTIIGQSLGGLMASEILIKQPAMFDNYMIVSPSLWWNGEAMLKEPLALHHIRLAKELKAYISVGAEGDMMERPAKQLVEKLKNAGNVTTYFQYLPDESHLTILHNALYKGFVMMNEKKK